MIHSPEFWIGVVISAVIPILFIQYNLLNRILSLYKKFCLHIQVVGLTRAKFIAMLESKFTPTKQSDIIKNSYFPDGCFYLTDADTNNEYENRNTKLAPEIIESKIKDQLSPYYKDLQQKINEGIKNKKLRKQQMIVKGTEKTIAEWFIDIYSFRKIQQAINVVNQNMATDPSIHFIGDKLGVIDYTLTDKKEVNLNLYKTDHFTFKVFKEIYKDKLNKPIFKDIILRLNNTGNYPEEKHILLQSLAFLFSSFGIDIIIEGKSCQNVKSLLISARSRKIEHNGETLLHVPVNETFSLTDNEQNKGYSVYECVSRGIEEEIGIPATDIDIEAIKFHDFAIVTDEGEIGFSAHVKLDKMPIEQAQLYPGQDKYLEIEELLQVPFPNVGILCSDIKWNTCWKLFTSLPFLNPKNKILEKWFLNHHYQDKLALQWMSFTPLIFQRMILRNLQPTEVTNTCIAFILLTIITYYYWPESGISTYINYIVAIVIVVLLEYIKYFRNKPRYNHLLPFVPQWSGNVCAVQTTGKLPNDNPEANPNNGLSFGLLTKEAKKSVNTSDLRLSQPPYFAVRKAYSNKHFEIPISFYQMQNDNEMGSKLYFPVIDVTFDINKIHLKLKVNYDKTHIVSYSFIMRNINFSLDFQTVPDNNIKYKNYYKLSGQHNSQNKECKFSQLPESIKTSYQLYDCFTYKNDYYWSCTPKFSNKGEDEINYNLSKENCHVKSLYPFIETHYNQKKQGLKDKKEERSFIIDLYGDELYLQHVVNSFLSNSDNRRKMADIDIFMLQFILIRKNIIIANIN